MSKKTKLNRRQLEALVRSKLQEKLNIQEDVGDAIASSDNKGSVRQLAPQAAGTEGPATDISTSSQHGQHGRAGREAGESIGAAVGRGVGSFKRETGKWSDAIPRNQSMQEAQLNEFLGDLGQDLMDRYYGTGNYGGGTIHGQPWREVAATMARTGGYSKRDDEIAPANRKDAQNVKGPQPSAVDNLGPRAGAQFMREAVADVMGLPDVPETADLDDVEALAADEVMDDITEQAAGDAVKAAAANAEEDGDELGSMGDAVKNEHLSDKEWYDNQLFENLKKKWIR